MTRAREISNVLGRNIESTTFTATAGQTAFSITHAAGRIQVYMNGLLLDPTVDWTSDGSTVTLTEGAVAGDELEVVKFDNLAVADAIPRTGHTGTIDFSDATFVPPAGTVVQVKEALTTTVQTFNTGGVAISGTNLSITPKQAGSKFKIEVHVPVNSSDDSDAQGSASNPYYGIKFQRDVGQTGTFSDCDYLGTDTTGRNNVHMEASARRAGTGTAYSVGARYRMDHKYGAIVDEPTYTLGQTIDFRLYLISTTTESRFIQLGGPHGYGSDDNYFNFPYGMIVTEIAQ